MRIDHTPPQAALGFLLIIVGCTDSTPPSPPAHAATAANGYSEIIRALRVPESIEWDCQTRRGSTPSAINDVASTHKRETTDTNRPRFFVWAAVNTLLEHGFVVDASIYEDLPEDMTRHDLSYIGAAAEAVAALSGIKPQITRSVFRLTNHPVIGEDGRGLAIPKRGGSRKNKGGDYPMMGAEAIEAGREPIPLTIAPDPRRLRSFLESNDDRPSDCPWLPPLDIADISINEFIGFNLDYAFTLYFEGAERMTPPVAVQAFPMPDLAKGEGIQSPHELGYKLFVSINTSGKAVVQQNGLHAFVNEFNIGQPDGARCLGLVSTFSLFNKIWLVEVSRPDQPRCRYLAFPVADANGGARPERSAFDAAVGGKFENLLRSKLDYGPTIGSHSLLRLPLPLPADTEDTPRYRKYPQERLVVDEGIASCTPPVAIFRRGKTWRPYMPDYILDDQFSFTARGEGEAEIAVAFANIDPASLLKLLGALREVDVAPLLNDAALMQRLEQLAN